MKVDETIRFERPSEPMSTTEKITVNVNAVDLGYIDYFVSEGHYATRTEFIKTAIKAQLDKHEIACRQFIRRSEESGGEWFIGVGSISAGEVDAHIAHKKPKKRFWCVGMLVIEQDVPLEKLAQAYESIRVYGVCRAPKEIKAFYRL